MIMKTLCAFVVVMLTAIGICTVIYGITMFFIRPRKDDNCVWLIPFSGDEKRDVRRMMYAYERLELFGENGRCEVWGVKMYPDTPYEDRIRNLFAVCRTVHIMGIDEVAERIRRM